MRRNGVRKGSVMADVKRCRYCHRAMPRGSYEVERRGGKIIGYCCRSVIDCFNRIREQRNQFLKIGNQMSNVFFNISQRGMQLHPDDAELFKRMYQLWDSMKASSGL